MNERLAAGVVLACLLAAVCSCTSPAGRVASDADKTAPSGVAFDGALDFTLVNHTGATLQAIYVSPLDSEGWEENVLGRDELSDGEAVEIGFSPEEKAVRWDLRVEDGKGNSAEWKSLDLREISRITLSIGEGMDVVIAEAE